MERITERNGRYFLQYKLDGADWRDMQIYGKENGFPTYLAARKHGNDHGYGYGLLLSEAAGECGAEVQTAAQQALAKYPWNSAK